jgi:uncharacterized membrane protein
MTDLLFVSLRVVAIIGCALMAGLYFAFSNTIMPTLAKLEPSEGILVMQTINRTILNPLFLLLFVGTAIACVVLVMFSLGKLSAINVTLLILGAVIYILGSFIVTAMVNVPLNDTLATLAANAAASPDFWANYLQNWTTWNHVRTVASVTAALLLLIADFK